jgi:hypothetical protein
MYDYSKNDNSYAVQSKLNPFLLDNNLKNDVVAYLKKFSNKELIKYIDLTPMWDQEGRANFPKSFPYVVLDQVKLSSYHGFNFYLSPLKSYADNNKVIALTYEL